MALTLGACTDEEPKYTPAPAVEELPVFFSLEDNSEYELFENSTEIDVPIYRKSTAGELTVPVTVSATPDADGFTFPASVTFADGEKEAHFIIPLDMSKVKGRVDYKLTFAIADGVETPYYTDKVTYTLNYSPWDLVTGIDKDGNEVTKALFRDDLIAPMYNLDVVEYEVEMQANPENKNIVRIVDPYGEAWPYSVYGDYDTSSHHYMYFNITNPNAVFMCNAEGEALGTGGSDYYFHTGLTLDEDGEILLTTYYNYYVANNQQPTAEMYGTIAQGNLTYKTDKFLMSFKLDPKLTLYYANRNGQFRIIWPGAEEYVDPMTIWNPIGKGQFTDGIVYPIAFFEEGETGELPTYDVEIMQFAGDPALFRIMNPWKAGICPYGVDYSGDKYIELDTTNPDCVIMERQATGLAFGGNALYIMNYGAYILGKGGAYSDILDMGVNDTYKDGVIYSAPGNLLWGLAINGQIQLAQGEFEWQVVMPGAPAEPTAKAASTGRYFNGDAPLQLTGRARNAQPRWAVTEPVFSYATKTVK